jgi:signal transduction histidine kinase/ActR/RegA family two-component response regulator/HPt (histidine-containing phosphotransfer) domain-containing protein
VKGLPPEGPAELRRIFFEDSPARLERLAVGLGRLGEGGVADRDSLRIEAHSMCGAAGVLGLDGLAGLCGSVEDLLDEEEPDPQELRAAARLVHTARKRLAPPSLAPTRLRDRYLPHRFMAQLAVIFVLALIPAFGISIYDEIHGRSNTRALLRRDAAADAELAAAAERQVILGGQRLLTALSQVPQIRAPGSAGCPRVLSGFALRLRPYVRFGVLDGNGRVLCASAPVPAGFSAASLPIFREVRSTGRFSVAPLGLDPLGGGVAHVAIGQPLAGSRLHRGQLVAAISLGGLQDVLARVALPSGSSITVFDRRGVVLARRPQPKGYVGTRANLKSVLAAGPLGGASETKGSDGVSRVFASQSTGPWYVSVAIPTAPEYARLRHHLLVELLLVGGLGLLGLLLGLIGARRTLERPLAALVGTAGRLGGGDLTARTGVDSHGGELGDLAESIDSMAEALERRTDERERAVADLGSLTGELEQRVNARTVGLEEARDLADRGSEAKTAFLARLSHELRTPLNALRGFSKLLAAERLEPADRIEAAKHVSAAAEHMTRLVDELLDTARVEAGQLRVDLTSVSAAAVVDDVLSLAEALAADHGVALLAPEVPPGLTVRADRGRLRQALLNLVTNAVVYNRRGGTVTVRVDLREGRVLFDVLDTGAGIAAADLERLFIPYDRLGRGPESSGLGLGLALSRRIVEAMGGTISVESDEGVGTRFTIEVAETPAPRIGGDSVRLAPARANGKRRVLYVEDNPTSLKLVELMLRGRGIELISATTAAQGLAAARGSHVDLILLDRQLPDGSGEDVLRELRRDETLRAVPIVMLSGDASRETIRRVLEAGADDYLTKPLEVDRAAEAIERFLRGSHD